MKSRRKKKFYTHTTTKTKSIQHYQRVKSARSYWLTVNRITHVLSHCNWPCLVRQPTAQESHKPDDHTDRTVCYTHDHRSPLRICRAADTANETAQLQPPAQQHVVVVLGEQCIDVCCLNHEHNRHRLAFMHNGFGAVQLLYCFAACKRMSKRKHVYAHTYYTYVMVSRKPFLLLPQSRPLLEYFQSSSQLDRYTHVWTYGRLDRQLAVWWPTKLHLYTYKYIQLFLYSHIAFTCSIMFLLLTDFQVIRQNYF